MVDLNFSLADMIKAGHYAKAYDTNRPISESDFNTLTDFLHSMASSVNAQPTRYFIISSTEGKNALADSFKGGFSDNLPKIRTASHVVVCATMSDLSKEYLDRTTELEQRDGRFATRELKERWDNVKQSWINSHRYDQKDLFHWSEKQTYFAASAVLMAAAAMGINGSPIEGFDSGLVDAHLGLRQKGLTTTLLLLFGYRDAPNDFAVNLPKSRLPKDEVFTFL